MANEVFSLCSLADVWVQAPHAGVWELAHVGRGEVVACGLTEKEKKSEQCVEKYSSQSCAGPAVFF